MRIKQLLLLFLTSLLLLTGCSATRSRDCKKLAETYLTQLQTVYDDTLTLVDKEPEQYGEMYTYFAKSEKYQEEFRVNVNGNNALTDTYFSLALAESAQKECSRVIIGALPALEGAVHAQPIQQIVASSLSGKLFDSIQDAQAACQAVNLLNITLSPKNGITPEELSVTLNALKDQGLFATVTVTGDDTIYEVSEDGLYIIEQGQIDSGAMMTRREFGTNT